MRGIRVAGAGLGLALGVSGALAQEPAARLGTPVSELTARGQAPAVPPTQGGTLSPTRPVPQGPTVTEQRTVPVPSAVAPPPVVFGTPITNNLPTTYLGVPPPVVGTPPTVVPTNIEPPLVGPGAVASTGPFGILTGGLGLGNLFGGGGQGFGGPSRLRLDADFLLWFVKSGSTPPLVTTGPAGTMGSLGEPTTSVLSGGDTLGRTLHTGGRFSGVYWLDSVRPLGVDGSLFFLARRGFNETFTTDQYPLLARPFFNLNQNVPFSEIVAAPGLATGSVVVSGDTHAWGADANVRRHLWGGCDWRLDGLVGFRYLNFSETLTVTESFVRTPNSPPDQGIPNAVSGVITDRFRTENNFYGVNVGLTGERRWGRWFAEARASVAFGSVFQSVTAEGSQQITFPTGVATYPGGLLAVPGNLGTFSQRKFGVVPEAGLKLGCHITDRWRVNVGYNFLYLNSVLRPGDQIDTGLDVTRIPNFPLPGTVPPLAGVRPLPPLRTTGVFVQGISFGLQWAF